MRRILCFILVFTACIHPVMADDKSDAEKVVRNTVETVLECLSDKDLSDESKRVRVIEIINPVFDFSLMGKLTLGRRHWPKLDEEERKEFTELFTRQLQNSYAGKIELFSNEKVEYEKPLQVKSKIHVPTTVISKDERTKMLYKLYKSKETWRIYDVEIQGVSIISSYRAQYGEVLKTGSVKKLLTKIRNKVETKTKGDDEK